MIRIVLKILVFTAIGLNFEHFRASRMDLKL